MSNYTREDVIRIVREEDVEFIRLQFADMFGNLKNVAVTASQIERAFDNNCIFDASAIDGFVRIEESDMFLHPDFSTFKIFPWRPQQSRVAGMLCDVCRPNGEPFLGDSRYILKRAVKKAEEFGYTLKVGAECEFFLFDTDENAMPTVETKEKAGYFDVGPLDFGENARRDIVMTLEDMGFVIESSHHEIAPAQHEIDFMYDEALSTADNIMLFKLAVRTIAKRHGLHATFMPKPKQGVNGSGMHINMSLHGEDGRNVFEDASDPMGLSKEAYYFIGGLIKHIKGMAAVTNPIVNSYKRLVPGYEAPVYIAWSATNRSPLIRIPSVKNARNTRIELRSPDSAANPYLTLALCLCAGLDGIANKIEPPKVVSGNIFEMSDKEKKALGIENLPGSLMEAVTELEKDEFIKEVLGSHIAEKYIDAKKREWHEYSTKISEWEIENYLYKY